MPKTRVYLLANETGPRYIDVEIPTKKSVCSNDGLSFTLSEEPPITPGWYWYCGPDIVHPLLSHVVTMPVYVDRRPGHDYLAVQAGCEHTKREFYEVGSLGAYWAGPIPEPMPSER